MRKIVTTLILFLSLFFYATNTSFAYKYRVYDPSTNKTYYANMMTLQSGEPNIYYLGLFGAGLNGYLVISPNTDKNNSGLIGGQAFEAYKQDAHIYKWRELNHNNYYEEMNSIINERKQESMQIHPAYIQ